MSVKRDPYRKDPNAPKDFYARRVIPADMFENCIRTTWWFREMSRRSNGKVFFKNVANSADDICLHIPASYGGSCKIFVERYGSYLCNQAINNSETPIDVCSKILEPLIFNLPTPPSWGTGGCWHNSFSTVIYDLFQKDKHRFRKKHTLEELYQQTTKLQEKQFDELKYPADAYLELGQRFKEMKDQLLQQRQQNDNNTPKPQTTPLWKMFGYMVLPHHWLDPAPPVTHKEPETVDVAFDFTWQDYEKRGLEGITKQAIERGKLGKETWLAQRKEESPRIHYTRDEAKWMYNVLKALLSDRPQKAAIYEHTDMFDPQLAEKLESKRQKEIDLLKTQVDVLQDAISKRDRQARKERGLVPTTRQEVENLKDLAEDIHFQTAEGDIQRLLQGEFDSEYPLNVGKEAYEDVPRGYQPIDQEYTKQLKKILSMKKDTLSVLEKHSENYQNKKLTIKPERQTEWEEYVASKLIWEDLQKNPQEMEIIPPSEIDSIKQKLQAPKTQPPPFIFGIDLASLTADPRFNKNFPELVNVGQFHEDKLPKKTNK